MSDKNIGTIFIAMLAIALWIWIWVTPRDQFVVEVMECTKTSGGFTNEVYRRCAQKVSARHGR